MEHTSLNEKKIYFSKLQNKFPDRIPIIIEKTNDIILDNYKYLLPKNIPVSTFLSIIKTKLKNTKNQALFTFVKNGDNYIMVPMTETIESLYCSYKAEDNFLYFKFGIENTFG
jgi:hypothetical protein